MTTYSTDSEGKFIPASQRPDGTWRKARRVRDGYVPQEEVPLYKSKGKEFAQRKSTLPPGMCPIAAETTRKERERQERIKAKREAAALAATAALTAAIEAPAKAGPMKQTMPGVVVLPTKEKTKNSATTSSPSTENAINALTNGISANLTLNDETTDLAKQLKKLRKKIREIESIEERLKSGELKKPEKDQLDKAKRKNGILKEIKEIEEQLGDEALAATSSTANITTTNRE